MSGVARGDRRKGWRGAVALALLFGLVPTAAVVTHTLSTPRDTAADYRDYLYRRYLESQHDPSAPASLSIWDRG